MVQTIAISAGAVLLVLNQLGLLNWLKPKSASDVAAELELGDRRERRLEAKIVERDKLIAELRVQRTNEPVLELVGSVAEICSQTLTKLASFNGSLAHIDAGLGETRDGLNAAVESMKTLTGLIAELHDLPMRGRDT